MARNPKSDANLRKIQKGELSHDEAKARGKKGGQKSGETRRAKRDAKSSIRYLLELAATGNTKDNLVALGIPENEQTNMAALQARFFVKALAGDLDSYLELMKLGGFNPEENRKERESISSEKRKDMETKAKMDALAARGIDAGVTLSLNDEDGNDDVMIYLPQIEDEENLTVENKVEQSPESESIK